ncbi:MAG: NUDIX domain-containing protein [Bacteroidales bacterium]|nr:NUDIX domain-containing protein [Bacteroidales bacterium]
MNIWKISFQYWMIVFVSSDAPADIQKPSSDRQWICMDDSHLERCFAELTQQQHDVWVLCKQSLRRVVQYCMDRYIFIKAAGGIVQRPNGERLLILRNGKWDMAKGKVEAGETLREAALREVQEETGIHVTDTQQLWLKAYHIYDLYGGWHLKQTTWYVMPYQGDDNVAPQGEEGITQAVWVPINEWRQRLNKSYSMLREVASCER